MGPKKKNPGELTFTTRLKIFLSVHWRGVICVLTPIICIFMVYPFPSEKYQWCAYCLVVMAVYWVTECIPLQVTSFLPIVIFPLTDVMNTRTTCKCYMNDTILMFLGSIMLATAVEQSGLHTRLALNAIKIIGCSHYKILFAVCFITMFMSMWITNTAATTMMVPIVFALLKVYEGQGLLKIFEKNKAGELQASRLTTCYFCSITFAATIGGIGTLVGTATNLVFKGLFTSRYPTAKEYLSFPLFSAFSIPYMIVLNIVLYICMLVMYMGVGRSSSKDAKQVKITPASLVAAKRAVDNDLKNLGRIKMHEIMVLILFGSAMLMFFFRSPQIFTGWGDMIIDKLAIEDKKHIKDSAAAALVCFLMILLPSTPAFFKNFTAKYHEQMSKNPIKSVLDWHSMNAVLPYSFIFLLGCINKIKQSPFYEGTELPRKVEYGLYSKFLDQPEHQSKLPAGGGFALSTAAKAEHSNLNGKIGDFLKNLKSLPNQAVLFIIITFTVLITNFASNVAVCNVIAPIAMQMAKEIGQNPLWYNIAAGFSASYCFLLPVGTPGNLIVQSSAKIPTSQMIFAGIAPTITTIMITWVFICFYAPVIWPDISTVPAWATT